MARLYNPYNRKPASLHNNINKMGRVWRWNGVCKNIPEK